MQSACSPSYWDWGLLTAWVNPGQGTQRPPTTGDAEHTHDADDGGVDGQGSVHLNFLQRNAHDGQEDDGQVQLVPPGQPWVKLSVAMAWSSCGSAKAQPEGKRAFSLPPMVWICLASKTTHLSLKNLRNPKATSFSAASKTKTMVKT